MSKSNEFLLQQNEELRESRRTYIDKNERLEEKIEKLTECVEFYADNSSWRRTGNFDSSIQFRDVTQITVAENMFTLAGGKQAREMLIELTKYPNE